MKSPGLLCESVLDQAHSREHLEIFARRVHSTAVRSGTGQELSVRCGDGWLIGIRSQANGVYGTATGDMLDEGCLVDVLTDARTARACAPHEAPVLSPVPPARHADSSLRRNQSLPAIGDMVSLVRETGSLVSRPATVTCGFTRRTVLRYDSSGWAGAYGQVEAQVHIRSAERGLDGAQGARIRRQAGEIDPHQVAREFARGYEALTQPKTSIARLDWIALSPMITARVVGRLSRAFLRAGAEADALTPGTVLGEGRQVLTLVDDGREEASTVGSPFDDEGTARQRTTLLSAGRVLSLLGSRHSGPSTGNAAWTDWDTDVGPAPTACFLEPTDPAREPDLSALSGTGLLAEDLRGFRGGLDLLAAQIEFELTGSVIRGGLRTGSGRVAVSTTPGAFLGAFQHVYSGTEFYRIQGLRGGSWCLLDGRVAYHEN